MKSRLVDIRRLKPEDSGFYQVKDPTVVAMPDGTFTMFTTLDAPYMKAGMVGRFTASDPAGPWQEQMPAVIHNLTGPEICAPSVNIEQRDGKTVWTMYIQSACFAEDGVIAAATSADGIHFHAETVMTKDDVPKGGLPVVGLYDVAVSEVTRDGKACDCMVFSGYREVGCGDIYIALREKGAETWEAPKLALRQEDVPFHNRPGSANFEWGLEGAKVMQLAPDAFLMVGVCFLDKDKGERGTRQRIFFAAAASVDGPFLPMGMPIDPAPSAAGAGENGHAEIIDRGNKLGILYQERAGEGHGKPWHLRYAEADKDALLKEMRERLAPPPPPPAAPARGRRSKPGFTP
jgi:hypothetical protein